MCNAPLVQTAVIGDTHADFDKYRALLRHEEAKLGHNLPSIHVGDYGFGYFSAREEQEVTQFHRTNRRHRFIRGNHDDVEIVQATPGFLPDGSISGRVLFLGGAGGNLTATDTEILPNEMSRILTQIKSLSIKPSVIISHDAPQAIAKSLRADGAGIDTALRKSRTRSFLSAVLDVVHPDLWIFGHWHCSWARTIDSTHFRGMGFAECFTIPLPWSPDNVILL